ncbi:MAG: hypothetical protein PVI90_04850, partial [Desulfobacteraceae bacterium]
MSEKLIKIIAYTFISLMVMSYWGCSKEHILKVAPSSSEVPIQIQKVKADLINYEKQNQIPAEDGSLWSESAGFNSLFVNHKARKVGD